MSSAAGRAGPRWTRLCGWANSSIGSGPWTSGARTMRIVGSGFLARQLRSIATKHADVEMFAAGVSNSAETRGDAFDCEARRVYDAIERCAREGRRLVYFSTSSKGLYGDQPGPVFEDGPAFPVSAY